MFWRRKKRKRSADRRINNSIIVITFLTLYIKYNTYYLKAYKLKTWDYLCYYYCRCCLCLHPFHNSLLNKKKKPSFILKGLYYVQKDNSWRTFISFKNNNKNTLSIGWSKWGDLYWQAKYKRRRDIEKKSPW